MRIQYAIPEGAVSKPVLDAALETSTRANQSLIEAGLMPWASDEIKRGRVKWRPEPFSDGEHFDLGHQVTARGWGDCDDLAPWLAAELRARHIDPHCVAEAIRSGKRRWHAIVRLSNGDVVDPSEHAGMSAYKRAHAAKKGVHGAINGPICQPGRGALAFKRYMGRIAARADLPIDGCDMHVSGVCVAEDLDDAINGAMNTAMFMDRFSEAVDPFVAQRLNCLQQALQGYDEDDIEGGEGTDIGFLPALAALAPTALSMASSLMPGSGGGDKKPAAAAPAGGGGPGGYGMPGGPTVAHLPTGAPVTVTPYAGAPGGPIVIRF
jgi:hypothetical protein